MSQDHRSPGAEVVQIAIAIRIPEICPFTLYGKWRIASDSAECAYRGVYAAGQKLLCAAL
jgi:hypothetical protein